MKTYSVFNDVLGPVMHGPSSSHTAASHRLGFLARALLGSEPAAANIVFDPRGSYGRVFRDQGSDLAFAAGIMGWDITDDRFFNALSEAERIGVAIEFRLEPLPEDDHPNAVRMELSAGIFNQAPSPDRFQKDSGETNISSVSLGVFNQAPSPDRFQKDSGETNIPSVSLKECNRVSVVGRSVGGGAVEIISVDGRKVWITGEAYEYLVETERGFEQCVLDILDRGSECPKGPIHGEDDRGVLIQVSRTSALDEEACRLLTEAPGVRRIRIAPPVLFVVRGQALFESGEDLAVMAESRGLSAGAMGLAYECGLLELPEDSLNLEMEKRFEIMQSAVESGLKGEGRAHRMKLLRPTAQHIFQAENRGELGVGGIHTRAAARSMAALHVNSGMGLVCAAPTGGSAGVLPGVLVSMLEDLGLDRSRILSSLWAASAVGLVFLMKGRTFAAEEAGCQVEIGAAGAMAAAAVTEAYGGSARQALDAAAIALQNTMGSPCDLVRGVVEIPCHTRNAVAASSAFVCADLILGGYENPIPLDETVEASLAVGRSLPRELRCTALGGLAATPSAKAMKRQG